MYSPGTFLAGGSFIYKLDPRLKLTFVVILSVFILWSKTTQLYFLALGLFMIALANGVRLRIIAQSIKPLFVFIILIFLAHALFGDQGGSFSGISVSGVHAGFIVILRFLCLIVVAVLLTITTTPSALIASLKYFLRPLKYLRVSVDDLAVMTALALRLMPMVLAQKERIESAQKARCYEAKKTAFLTRLKAFLLFMMAVLRGSFRRADELALAMEARNYVRGERSSAVTLKMTSTDYWAMLVFAALLFAFIVFDNYWG